MMVSILLLMKMSKKWDQEQHNPEETRLPTLMELEEEDRLVNEKVIENLPPEKRQEYEIEMEYASGKHFQSIYEEVEGIYKEEELPDGDIIFLERERDPARQHSSLKCMTIWEGVILSCKNPAYAFNKEQDNKIEYADAPYMPQLIAEARGAITDVHKEELHKRDQIKSALVIHATYVSYTYKGTGDISDWANYTAKYHHPYHRSYQREILSKQYIDEHITQSGVEIDQKIESYLKEESGKILLRLEMVLIESYTLRRALRGSYKPTPPPKLANKKCTINPDNQGLIDLETNRLSEKCLKGATGCYFAYQDGIQTT